VARFGFSMPILPSGDYVIQVAIATGSQEEHQQQHWIHEALAFKSHNTSVKQGLAGLQLHKLSIEVVSK
jgi:lipopolysaccharide transport system ATP-binding protein